MENFRHDSILPSNQHCFCWTQEQSSTCGKAGNLLLKVKRTIPTCSPMPLAAERFDGTRSGERRWERLWSIGGHDMGTLCQKLSWFGLAMNPDSSPISSPLGNYSQR